MHVCNRAHCALWGRHRIPKLPAEPPPARSHTCLIYRFPRPKGDRSESVTREEERLHLDSNSAENGLHRSQVSGGLTPDRPAVRVSAGSWGARRLLGTWFGARVKCNFLFPSFTGLWGRWSFSYASRPCAFTARIWARFSTEFFRIPYCYLGDLGKFWNPTPSVCDKYFLRVCGLRVLTLLRCAVPSCGVCIGVLVFRNLPRDGSQGF